MFPPESRLSKMAGAPVNRDRTNPGPPRAPERDRGGIALKGIDGGTMLATIVAPAAPRLMGSLIYRNPALGRSGRLHLRATYRLPGIWRPWRPRRPWRPNLLDMVQPAASARAFLEIRFGLGPRDLRSATPGRAAADAGRTGAGCRLVPAASLASLVSLGSLESLGSLGSSPPQTRWRTFHVESDATVMLMAVVGPGPAAQMTVKVTVPRAQQPPGTISRGPRKRPTFI